MKTIAKIARIELAQLFYSPIAWFLLVAFLFQCGLAYTGMLENYMTQQDMGGQGLKYLTFLTSKIFTPPYGIWPDLVRKFYLYLPLLTMGLMSREMSSGTIKLLYSSPIKVREIILGKFAAMMGYNLALVLILALIVGCGLINIHNADAGMLFTGLLGIYLLLCTYASIGLFMSCLTSYQVVAALSTLVLLAALSYIGTVWQDIDFVRDLTYFLSITGRADHLLLGLITSKDLLYFVVIILVFLVFSVLKLQSDRESAPVYVRAVRYIGTVVAALALGYISSRPGLIFYMDNTATKSQTLTLNAQKIVVEMSDAPLEVTSYINLLDNFFWYGKPDQRNEDMARWEPYLRFKPDIHFKYVYYYDSTSDKNLFKYNPGMTRQTLAEKYAKSMKLDMNLFKTPDEIRKIIDVSPEQNRYVMQLKYKDRTTFLRLFNDQIVFPTETETSAALKRLLQAKMPKIGFVQGETERSIAKAGDRHYKFLTNEITFRNSLINQGFNVETFSLKDHDIPEDISAMVIADPKDAFDSLSLNKIREYIASGRNLLIAGEPGKQAVVAPLLEPLGVHMMDGMLVQDSKDFSPELLQSFLTPQAGSFTKSLQQVIEDSIPVTMRGAAGLTYEKKGGFTVSPLVMTDERSSWNKKIKPDIETIESSEDATDNNNSMAVMAVSLGGVTVSEQTDKSKQSKRISFAPEQGDQKGAMPVVLALSRTINGRQQRIVVSGDADFLSNSELGRNNIQTGNFEFSTAIFSWFSQGEFPIDTTRPPSADKKLDITDAGLSVLKILLLGVFPGVLLIMGSILLIRRKRK